MILNRISITAFLALFLLSLGQASADCDNCEAGWVRVGHVLYPCVICEGVKGKDASFPDKKPDTNEPLQALQSVGHADKEPTNHHASVVRIVVSDGPSTHRGSGVVIEHDGKPLVLTAWHVVRTNASKNVPIVHFQDGTQAVGRVVKSDDAFDLAAIECERYGAVAVPLAASPKDKEPLAVAGYGPHPSTFRAARGRLIGRGRPTSEHATDFIEVNVGARQGDSGGPVFNDAGEVAGILWGSSNGVTVASHSGRLREFLGNSPKELDRSSCPNGRCPKR